MGRRVGVQHRLTGRGKEIFQERAAAKQREKERRERGREGVERAPSLVTASEMSSPWKTITQGISGRAKKGGEN